MLHTLTDQQTEYLDFLRDYIRAYRMAPRLEEVADHFGVKSPTVHKALRALEDKGFLYFGRDDISGFYIRLIERAGSSETVIEVPINGKVNGLGEVYDFPVRYGHVPTLLNGANLGKVLALAITEDIPQASMLAGDLLICDYGKYAQPGDICIVPIGERYFLAQIISKTLDRDLTSLEVSNPYPIPETLEREELEKKLNWQPLAYDEDTHSAFVQILDEQKWSVYQLPTDFVVATALRLSRALAF